jgi:hypothetical protein
MAKARKKVAKTAPASKNTFVPSENQPQYYIRMKSRDPNDKRAATVGVGFINSSGGINIRLNPGVNIGWRDLEDFYLTLWPEND